MEMEKLNELSSGQVSVSDQFNDLALGPQNVSDEAEIGILIAQRQAKPVLTSGSRTPLVRMPKSLRKVDSHPSMPYD